jgi:hypothetical protein
MAIELQTNLDLQALPIAPSHVVNIKWVEDYFTGRVKAPVRVVGAANLAGTYSAPAKTLTLGATGVLAVDSVTLALNDRILLAGQTDATQNGIYTLTTLGDAGTAAVLTRAADFDSSDKIYPGVRVTVNEGTLYSDTDWKLTTDGTIVLDSTALVFIIAAASTGTAKFAATIMGDNLETNFAVTHGLGTADVQVSVRNLTTDALVMTDVTVTDNNTVTIGFAIAPTSAQSYRVVVVG